MIPGTLGKYSVLSERRSNRRSQSSETTHHRLSDERGSVTERNHWHSNSYKFYRLYERTRALNVEAKYNNHGVKIFRASIAALEKETSFLNANNKSSVETQNLHSILGVLYWLNPTHANFDRSSNARKAFDHARLASESMSLEARSLGLLVQLRSLPFLIRSKIVRKEELNEARREAIAFLSEESLSANEPIWSGLVLDGLGFSYYQHEHDMKAANRYLSNARDVLLGAFEKVFNLASNDETKPSLFNLVSSLIAVAFWDLGMCFEKEAENASTPSENLVLLFRARSEYERVGDFARMSPWKIYRAFSEYGIAGTYEGEAKLINDDSSDAITRKKELLATARNHAEIAFTHLKKWSMIEADILGGSVNARLCLKVAKLNENQEKRKLMNNSLNLVIRAKRAYNRRGVAGGRYSIANYGDVLLGFAEYYQEVSSIDHGKDADKTKEFIHSLKRSIENCLLSQAHFDEEIHGNRALDALLLGSRICLELERETGSITAKKHYHKLAEKQHQRSVAICKRFGWKDRLDDSNVLSH